MGPQGWADLFDGKMSLGRPQSKASGRDLRENPELSKRRSPHKLGSGGQGYDGRPVRVYCNGRLTYGELVKLKLKDNEDFGWVSFPGTDEAFIFVSDGFTLAKGAPHKQECIEWLKVLARGQEAFNPLKGSIQSDRRGQEEIWPYLNWAMESFASDTLVPSWWHGEAASAAFQQALNDAITSFVVDKKVTPQ